MHRSIQLSTLALLSSLLGSAQALPPQSVTEPDATAEVHTSGMHADLMSFLLQQVGDPTLLRGYRVAILAADGVDGFDLEIPRNFLTDRGASVQVIVPRAPMELKAAGSGAAIQRKTAIEVLDPSGEQRTAGFDRFVDQVRAEHYDAIYVPGNRSSSAQLVVPHAVAFLQEAVRAGKPVFATGNAPLVLLEAGLLDGQRATGDSSTLLRLALSPAIATDAAYVRAGVIHTSRDAFDIPALMDALVRALLATPASAR